MCSDTPPPMDDPDDIEDDVPLDDIEVIEDVELFGGDDDGEDEEAGASVQDDSELTFSNHSGAVFCCAIDGTATYAATGGEDDRAFVWNITTGEVLFECTGHKDSVVCVGFNSDSSLVATGDMSGIIKVWKLSSKEEIWNFESSDLTWLEWHQSPNILLAGTADGNGWMWCIPSGDCKTFQSFGLSVSCGKIMHDGKRAVMGYDDGSVRFWDLKNASVIHTVAAGCGHSNSVTTIDAHQDNSLIVTGSVDSTSQLINSNNGKVVATFHCGEGAEGDVSRGSVESVAFFNSLPLVATGTLQGVLSIWDVPTHVQRLSCKQSAAIVKLVCDYSSPVVYTAGLDGIVRMWDGRSGVMEKQWGGHVSEVLDISITRDGSTILTASEDQTCKLFKNPRPS